MTKWKQPSNGITAVIVPQAVLELFHDVYWVVASLPLCFSDRLCVSPSTSIAMLNWSSHLSSEGSRAISTAGRRRPVPFQPATPVTMSLCVRDSSAPTQVSPTPIPINPSTFLSLVFYNHTAVTLAVWMFKNSRHKKKSVYHFRQLCTFRAFSGFVICLFTFVAESYTKKKDTTLMSVH